MQSGISSSVPSSSGLFRDRSYRLAPAGPRRPPDAKSDVKASTARQHSSNAITSSNVTAVAGSSSSAISVDHSQPVDSDNLQRKELMAGSRSKASAKDALPPQQPPSRSRSYNATALTASPLCGSPAPDAGRYGTINSSSRVSSPTSSSPLTSPGFGRTASRKLGPSPQRSHESFATNQTQRRTTTADSQASSTTYSHLQSSPSTSTSESFRAHPSTSRAGRQASASVSGKSSAGTGSDREGGGHLDLKRLLSKPALPNHSGSSIISLPSDSEPSASPSASRRLMTAQAQAQDILRQRTAALPLRERVSARSMNELGDSPSRPGVSVSPRVSSTPPSREPERQRDPLILKPRAVLRRKVSARSGVSTPSAATIKTSSVQSSAQTNSFSSNETSRGSASRQPARSSETARPGAPSASTSRRVGGSGTADPISVRAGLKDASPPSGLTPAGAVAHAYKQQEERREKLAEMSGGNDHLDTLHSMHSQTSVSTLSFAKMPDSDDDLSLTAVDVKTDGPIEPYYTVFGSSSDRLFASREEEWQLSFDAYYGCGTSRTTTVTAAAAIAPVAKPDSGHGSGTAGGMKGLSRKMSGRLRKVTGTGRSGRDDSPQRGSRPERKEKDAAEGQGKVWMPYDGRESGTQDGGGISLDVGRASSVDGFVKVDVRETMSSIASNFQGDKFDASKRSHKPPIHDKDKSKQKEREKEKEEEPSSGGKLWKLMKRISTGGLRDKYSGTRDSLPPPPPVPALPKDFLPSRLTLDIQKPASDELVGESGILLSRFMQSRSSMSGLRPSTASSSQPTARAETDPRSRPSTGNKADPRPSTTTRSSSPMSSDIASTKFFQKTHSNRSSTTSYGEELPPLPGSHGVPLSQHIIEPSELYRMDDDDPAHPLTPMNMNRRKPVRSRSAPDDSSSLTSPVEVQPSLPFPPRRAQQSIGGKPPLPPPSPTIPAFNTSVAVNHFPSPPVLSLSMSEFGFADSPLSAPPRPRKSSRRGPNSSDSSPSPSSTNRPSPSSTAKPSPISFSSPRTPVLPSLSIDVFSRSRRSISTTARSKDAPSASPSSSLASPQSKSPLNFRDKESPRTALSEREKAAKWDDLLERSARAGGTLHLGETGLMSDKLRFSVVSEG